MKPTEEQQAILDCRARVLLINARAGTGKTSTLKMLASEHLHKKILYLVFNRKARDEAHSKFPRNVKATTVHSLALSRSKNRRAGQLGNFTPTDMLPAFRGMKNAQQLAALSHEFTTFYMNSPIREIESAMEIFHGQHLNRVSDELKDAISRYPDKVIEASRDILNVWRRKERPYPHDFYLKLFHRNGDFHKTLNDFDMVLVDEGQDLSPIMLDALGQCTKRIVIVGDTHQQIYSFRYATDAMQQFPSDEKLELTMSFRFGEKIAGIASEFIRSAKRDTLFQIRGNPEKASKVAVYTDLPHPERNRKCAILTRTNLALFEQALRLKSRRIHFTLEGNIRSVLHDILDIYRLSSDDRGRIRNPLIESFENMAALEKYAGDLDDFQLTGKIKVVKDYARHLPDAVFEILKISKEGDKHVAGPSITLTTVHGAKGQEYDDVYIDRDISAALSKSESPLNRTFNDDANIAYVAFTRAIQSLYLHQDFATILTPEWQAAVRQYKPAARSSKYFKSNRSCLPNKFSQDRHNRPLPHRPLPGLRRPQPSPKKTFTEGDRVKTNHGVGTVIEIEGEKYLIDLDGQSAKLWQTVWAMKKA